MKLIFRDIFLLNAINAHTINRVKEIQKFQMIFM